MGHLAVSDFGAFVTDDLPEMQALAESLMTLQLRAYAPGLVLDGEDIEVPGYTEQGDTSGKLQGGSASSRDGVTRTVRFGSVDRPVFEAGLHIPVESFVVDGVLQIKPGDQGIGWEFEVVEVGVRDDSSLVGRRFLVTSLPAKSYATARRLDVAEVS